jgi:hypothetical protein
MSAPAAMIGAQGKHKPTMPRRLCVKAARARDEMGNLRGEQLSPKSAHG